MIAGNGGSAADAQHFAAEIVGRFGKERPAMPAIALTTDTSILTAIANDYGFEKIFSRQIEALAKPGDIFFAISTSGNSSNILEGLKIAQRMGCLTIGLTGQTGGKMKNFCDFIIKCNSKNPARVQEIHITIIHLVCGLIEKNIFEK